MRTLRTTPKVLIAALLAALALPCDVWATNRPLVVLAKVEQGQAEVSRYLVSEKLDGVRAFWDGRRLLTRQGNPIQAPAWFTQGFPAQPLDGELWIGRGQFEQVSAIIRRKSAVDAAWRDIRFCVFELPEAAGTFRERVEVIKSLVADARVPWLQAVEQFDVTSRLLLEQKLNSVLDDGGEGLMLHLADATFVAGRSDVLLKMKRWNDAEATVIGYRPGKGKFVGQVGALRLRTPDGVEFFLGTGLGEALRRDPPPLGAVVTYRFRELTREGRPRFASYYRMQDF